MQAKTDLAGIELAGRDRVEVEASELRARLLESREAERLLLAQELHDGPIQDLLALSYTLHVGATDASLSHQDVLRDELIEAIRKLRALCRELRPSTLLSSGLGKAIRSHLACFAKRYPSYLIRCDVEQEDGLSEMARLALYRIYQHALMNIVRHAQAEQIFINFRIHDGQAALDVRDNGVGFTVPENLIEFARCGHLGLVGGLERAEAVGGEFIVASTPGEGTKITVRVPIDAPTG